MSSENLLPPIDGDFLQKHKIAAQATETKPLNPSEKQIYSGLFRIATSGFEVHGIDAEKATGILEASYPERFNKDYTAYWFRQEAEVENRLRRLRNELDSWSTN